MFKGNSITVVENPNKTLVPKINITTSIKNTYNLRWKFDKTLIIFLINRPFTYDICV